MRIIHVITRFVRGGADENTLLSCNGQAARGHEVHLVHGVDAHPKLQAQLDTRVHVHVIPSLVRDIHPAKDVMAMLALWRLIGRIAPDIVHTHTSKAGVLGRLAGWLGRAEAIVHGVHILPFLNSGPAERWLYLVVERALAPLTHAFLDVSAGMRDACLAHGVGDGTRHWVVPSGMDTRRFQAAADRKRFRRPEVLASRPDAEVVFMAAAFEPRKRHLALLELFQHVARVRPNAVLVLAGEGPERLGVEEKVRQLGLENRILFLGFVENIEEWLAHSDVCVLTSEREGLPRVVVQYALACRPVVATRLPGIEAVVRDGETGFLVEPTRLEEMAKRIIAILSDRAVADRLSDAARGLNLLPWSAEAMVDSIECVYASIISRSPGTPLKLRTNPRLQ